MKKYQKLQRPLKEGKSFTLAERELIVQEYLKSGLSKQKIWQKYTGQINENGQLLRWIRQLGYPDIKSKKKAIIESMPAKNQDPSDFENLQLQKRIAELEEELKEAKLKAIAYSTMVDIAEKEFNIAIRKKYSTKPSK